MFLNFFLYFPCNEYMYKHYILNIYNTYTNHIPPNEIFIDHQFLFINLSSFLTKLYIFVMTLPEVKNPEPEMSRTRRTRRYFA